jgi:hypothetical protein
MMQGDELEPKAIQKRSHFTHEEDRDLINLVNVFGNNWDLISEMMKSRTRKQCRERYWNFLSPTIINPPWTKEEISKLINLVGIHGSKWKFLMPFFPGRSESNLKNKWLSVSKNMNYYEEKSKKVELFDEQLFATLSREIQEFCDALQNKPNL